MSREYEQYPWNNDETAEIPLIPHTEHAPSPEGTAEQLVVATVPEQPQPPLEPAATYRITAERGATHRPAWRRVEDKTLDKPFDPLSPDYPLSWLSPVKATPLGDAVSTEHGILPGGYTVASLQERGPLPDDDNPNTIFGSLNAEYRTSRGTDYTELRRPYVAAQEAPQHKVELEPVPSRPAIAAPFPPLLKNQAYAVVTPVEVKKSDEPDDILPEGTRDWFTPAHPFEPAPEPTPPVSLDKPIRLDVQPISAPKPEIVENPLPVINSQPELTRADTETLLLRVLTTLEESRDADVAAEAAKTATETTVEDDQQAADTELAREAAVITANAPQPEASTSAPEQTQPRLYAHEHHITLRGISAAVTEVVAKHERSARLAKYAGVAAVTVAAGARLVGRFRRR